jgi:hypothetical protein
MSEPTKDIETHDEFQRAVLRKQAAIASDRHPTLEVAPELFAALAEGADIDSLTYGKPGVRVFPKGTTDKVLGLENVPADRHREMEIKKISEAFNK